MPEADTDPFRGDVELLMVSPNYRRRGLANKLHIINHLEEIAREKRRTLLQLAEKDVYPRLGYIFVRSPNIF
ncbi:hypothetical protein V8C37DRAFT_290432 [Trichoderma ceciliae]